MKIELITTGTELLTGEVLNTHVGAIGERLEAVGLQLERQTSVPDGGAVESAMAEAMGRAGVVLVTGGLGPTPDDVTREAAARLRKTVLLLESGLVAGLEAYFAERGMDMAPANLRQAYVPAGAEVLPNDRGTAPGLYFPAAPWAGEATCHLFLLPGPPREMLPMFEQQVLPMLQRLAGDAPNGRGQQTLRVMGLGESEVVQRLGEDFEQVHDVTLAYCIGEGDISLRLSGDAGRVAAAAGAAADKLGPQLVSEQGHSIAAVVVEGLRRRGETLALAESCTGGGIGARLTAVAGASDVFRAGWITYANETKASQLGVEAALLQRHGAVSAEVAAAMAAGALNRSGADWALAVTGIAGPAGGSESKPVGTVHLALAGGSLAEPRLLHRVFRGDRDRVRMLTEQHALDLLRLALRDAPGPGTAELPRQPLTGTQSMAVAPAPGETPEPVTAADAVEPPEPATGQEQRTPEAGGTGAGASDQSGQEDQAGPATAAAPSAVPPTPLRMSAPKPMPKAMPAKVKSMRQPVMRPVPGSQPVAPPAQDPDPGANVGANAGAPAAPVAESPGAGPAGTAGLGQGESAEPSKPAGFGARPLVRPLGRPRRRPLKTAMPGAERSGQEESGD